jgi:integrase
LPKITEVERAGGRVAYRFTLNLGPDPVTGNRRQRVYTYDDLETAERERARLAGQPAASTDPRKVTVADALDRYLDWACFGLADATRVSYAGALLPVRDRLGRRKLASLTGADVEVLRDWLLTEGRRRGGTPGTALSPRSVRLTLGRLAAALDLAVAEHALQFNPASHVKMPRQDRRRGATWSVAELRAFAATAAGDRLAACWRLSLLGMRRGEVLGLRWRDVDLSARPDAPCGSVTIGRARILVYGKVVVKEPKSERGFRTLPLPDEDTRAALTALQVRQLEEQEAAGPAWSAGGGAYVAVDELGVPWHPDRLSDEFRRLCRQAGVPVIRLHDARHTANSLLAAAGVPDHIRAAWCGHTVAVNVATYTHARPEDLPVAAKALAGILSGSSDLT